MDDLARASYYSGFVENLFAWLGAGLENRQFYEVTPHRWRAVVAGLRRAIREGAIDPADVRLFLDDQESKFAAVGIPSDLAVRREEVLALLADAVAAQAAPSRNGREHGQPAIATQKGTKWRWDRDKLTKFLTTKLREDPGVSETDLAQAVAEEVGCAFRPAREAVRRSGWRKIRPARNGNL
jgi:hypothetical protein